MHLVTPFWFLKTETQLQVGNILRSLNTYRSKRCRCTKCQVEKQLEHFYKGDHGPQAWCKACMLDQSRRTSTADREK